MQSLFFAAIGQSINSKNICEFRLIFSDIIKNFVIKYKLLVKFMAVSQTIMVENLLG